MKRSPLMLFIKVFAGSFIRGDDEISVLNTKTPPLNFVFMVPATGLEPVRCLQHGDLNPMCLPVPPRRHIIYMYCQINPLYDFLAP